MNSLDAASSHRNDCSILRNSHRFIARIDWGHLRKIKLTFVEKIVSMPKASDIPGNLNAPGITRLFRPYDSSETAEFDVYGFTKASPSLLSAKELLKNQAILIRGRPWLGKTFVCKQIRDQSERLSLGKRVWYRQLSEISTTIDAPDSWTQWRRSKERACWLIDSIDEGESIVPNISLRITEILSEITAEQRSRLKIILFCREAETPTQFVTRLQELFGDGFIQVELMPLDQDSARSFSVATPFTTILQQIQRHSLVAVAGLPAALRAIESMTSTESPNGEMSVWKRVLSDLLKEPNHERSARARSAVETEKLFDAAAHLAITMTFSGKDTLNITGSPSPDTSVEEHVGADAIPHAINRDHARAVIRTAMFSRGRFAQRNIREMMCGFGLSEFCLRKIKPLITNNDGSLSRGYFGVLSILSKTCSKEVRDWILKKNRGFVPRVDAPYTIDDVRSILDSLEKIASRTQGNLYVFDLSVTELKTFLVPGLGEELVRRIAVALRSNPKLEIYLEIALFAKAVEVLPVAIKMALGEQHDRRVRTLCTGCVIRFGNDADLRKLINGLDKRHQIHGTEASLLSAAIREAMRRHILSISQAVSLIPLIGNDNIDVSSLLCEDLVKSLDREGANALLRRILPRLVAKPRTFAADIPLNHSLRELFVTAFDRALTEPSLDQKLEELLMRFALAKNLSAGWMNIRHDVEHFLQRTESLRRKLYIEDFSKIKTPAEPQRPHRNWLQIEDFDWLKENIVDLSNSDSDIWREYLWLAHRAEPCKKRDARSFARQHVPAFVSAFDKSVRRLRAESKRNGKARQANQTLVKPIENIKISTAIDRCLGSKIGLRDKLSELSWICFSSDSMRPTNVIGKWTELTAKVQSRVLKYCQKALTQLTPTPIPLGNSFPGALLHEAYAFRGVLFESPDSLIPHDNTIRKWLPAIHFLDKETADETIEKCFAIAPQATESVIITHIDRELLNDSEHMFSARNLNPLMWTSSLIEHCCCQIKNRSLPTRSRAVLVSILVDSVPASVEGLIREFANSTELGAIELAAIDGLLFWDPEPAVPIVKERHKKGGLAFLKSLSRLRIHGRNRINLNSEEWTGRLLVELYHILRAEFPPTVKRQTSGFITVEKELADTCDSIPWILLKRNFAGDTEHLNILCDEFADVRSKVEHYRAQNTVSNIVGSLGAAGNSHVPLPKLVRMLENHLYSVIRNSGDLLDVIEDTLECISLNAAHHLELLYTPRELTPPPRKVAL